MTADKDFLVATKEFVFNDLNELKNKIQIYRHCTFIIFNLDTQTLREVVFIPNGPGPLGLELSNGYLHDLSYIHRSLKQRSHEF